MFKKLLAATAFVALPAGAVLAQDAAGDPEAGEKVFRKCQACHMVGEDAQNRVGPALTDVIGRTAGTHEDFNYSDAMVAKGEEGLVWTAETLQPYLENPREYVQGTKMSFAGLRKEEERADVIAYLQSFSEGGEGGGS